MSNYFRKVRYDADNDILYIRFDSVPVFSYGDEQESGVVIMRNVDTEEVTGLTVYYPKRDQKVRESQLRKLGYFFDLSPYIS